MIRVIKFRAFVDGAMSGSFGFSDLGADCGFNVGYVDKDGCLVEFDDEPILMQYTGLTDKNGKEIYEGDLICLNGDKDMICACRWNVRYSCFDLYFSDVNDLSDGIDIWGNTGAEIIGNIYENKEVLDA